VILFVGPLQLGVAGAALATVVSQGVSVVLCLVYVWRKVPALHVHRAQWRVRREDLAEHLRLGLPMGFQASIIAIGTITVQVALNNLGSEAVASYTTAARVDSLALTFLNSLGLAASVYAAQNLGARRPDRIRRGVIEALWMAVIAAVILGALLVAFGEQMVRIFVGEGSDHMVAQAHQMLVINGVAYWVLGILFVLRGALQGLGHALIPTVTGAIELVARVAAAIVLGAVFGFVGVAAANPLAWIGAVCVLIPAYLHAHRQLSKLPVTPEVPTETSTIAVVGPTDGSMVVDAVVTAPIPVITPRRKLSLRRR